MATFLFDGIPFVPAYDLLKERECLLSAEEIVQIGLGILDELDRSNSRSFTWRTFARLESVSRRQQEKS